MEGKILEFLNNPQRLEAIRNSGMTDESADPVFDFMMEKICFDLRVPAAFISIVEPHRQFFKSQNGLPDALANARETMLSLSICQNIIYDGAEVSISDITADDKFCSHPARYEFNIIAYLGEPLFYDGQIIGAVCAFHTKPRYWSKSDRLTLQSITSDIEAEMYFRRLDKIE